MFFREFIVIFLITVIVGCDNSGAHQESVKIQTDNNIKKELNIKLQPKIIDYAFIVPINSSEEVKVWAKNLTESAIENNEVIETVTEAKKIGVIERHSLPKGTSYYLIDLGDKRQGYVESQYLTKDSNGIILFESFRFTGQRLRNASDYSFSYEDNCILHMISNMEGDLSKGEFETTAEFEARKKVNSSKILWFKNNITYTYVYDLNGSYNADKQEFKYESPKAPSLEEKIRYSYNSKPDLLEISNHCGNALGYKTVKLDLGPSVIEIDIAAIIKLHGAKYPSKFLEESGQYTKNFKVVYGIERQKAPAFKEATLLFGINPIAIDSIEKGTREKSVRVVELKRHITNLKGEVSYIFLITKDGRNIIDSYVSDNYKKTWKKDLQTQLLLAGYHEVGIIDGILGNSTKLALESATADGILPDAEASLRSTMILINYNRKTPL